MMEKYDEFRKYNPGDIKKLRLFALAEPMHDVGFDEEKPNVFREITRYRKENILKIAGEKIKKDKEQIVATSDLTYDKTELKGEILSVPISVIRSEEDIEDKEKAVMMALLKFAGFDYGDVKAVMKNVKWKPANGEIYYFITSFLDVSSRISHCDLAANQYYKAGNCFRTKEEAEKKAEEIKRILRK